MAQSKKYFFDYHRTFPMFVIFIVRNASKLPNIWTHSYYVESVGHISEDAIRRYIEEQKRK